MAQARRGGLRRPRVWILALASLVFAASALAQSPPFVVGGDARVDPADFQVTVFASGLDAPLSMQALADGSLLVGTNVGLLRFVDADDDGVADGPGTALYTGGSGLVTSLRSAGTLFFMARGDTISILRRGASPGDPLVQETSFTIATPAPWSHSTHALAVRTTGPDVFELYFNVGSKEDAVATVGSVAISGALTGSIAADSIARVVVDDSGPAVALSGLLSIASGVRNAFGIAFHPQTGDLYFEDNSIDGDSFPFEVSADELNRIAEADIGGAVEDFGFPDHYFAYRTNVEVGSGGVVPIVTFQPIPPPLGSESEGPAEIAFAPPLFPAGLADGVFVGFHGAFTTAGAANTDNPVVYVDPSGAYFHFVENTEAGVGHPDGLLATDDSLFVSDFTTANGFIVPGAGRIYRIRAIGPAAAAPLFAMPVLGVLVVALLVSGVALATRRAAAGV